MTVLKNGELYLYGFVGDAYWDEGFTASQVIDALIEIGRDAEAVVHINSGGGYTDDGVAIYNALIAHKGKVTIIVEAMAASSASLIAMAGDERIMLSGSLMMIHDPSGVTWGTADDHAKGQELLDKLADSMAGIYADVANDNTSDIREEMKQTLWLTADEAIERGFATGSGDGDLQAVAAFDYRVFANAPDRLCALAKKNSWSLKAAMKNKADASAPAKHGQQGDHVVTKPTGANKKPAKNPQSSSADGIADDLADTISSAVAADRERRTSVLALDETKGREALAESLFVTDMSIDQIKAALTAAPSGSAEPDTEASYEASRNPVSGLSQPAGGGSNTKAKIDRNAIFAARAKQTEGN